MRKLDGLENTSVTYKEIFEIIESVNVHNAVYSYVLIYVHKYVKSKKKTTKATRNAHFKGNEQFLH